MYNRYIPQSDGSFRRSRMQDHAPRPEPLRQEQRPPKPSPPQSEPFAEVQQPNKQQHGSRQNPPPRQSSYAFRPESRDGSITGFLKNLLPKDFDTGDLLVVILLLLMSTDCAEDQNSALLTLALYLFM